MKFSFYIRKNLVSKHQFYNRARIQNKNYSVAPHNYQETTTACRYKNTRSVLKHFKCFCSSLLKHQYVTCAITCLRSSKRNYIQIGNCFPTLSLDFKSMNHRRMSVFFKTLPGKKTDLIQREPRAAQFSLYTSHTIYRVTCIFTDYHTFVFASQTSRRYPFQTAGAR